MGGPLAGQELQESLRLYDDFYVKLGRRLDEAATRGPFVVLDLHSYNHRREGADAPPAPARANPEVNVGTGSLDRSNWGRVVDRFIEELGHRQVIDHVLDVRENVRFRGGEFSRWVNQRYGDRGCALALEFKKIFMDEWTGAADERHLEELRRAVAAVGPLVDRGTRFAGVAMIAQALPVADLAVDRALADIASSFRFLLDVTTDRPSGRANDFFETGRVPEFEYRPLADDPALTTARLADVPINDVEDPPVATLLQEKQRELLLMVQMLSCRGSAEFRLAEHRSVRRGRA